MKLNKYEFGYDELTSIARIVYDHSTLIFYTDSNGLFYVASNFKEKPHLCITGTLDDVNEYLESLY